MSRLAEATLRISESSTLKLQLTLLTIVLIVVPSAALMSTGFNPHWVLPLAAMLVVPLQYAYVAVLSDTDASDWRFSVKRIFDLLFAVWALWLVLPIWVVITVAIRLKTGKPAVVVRERFDLSGQKLRLFLFRTTLHGQTTPLGTILRRSALDQLPQFLNVLRGELSIVGPRPLSSSEESEAYQGLQGLRFFRCGITGFWQISKTRVHANRRFYDAQYIRGWSLGRDLRILLETLMFALNSDWVQGHAPDGTRPVSIEPQRPNPFRAFILSSASMLTAETLLLLRLLSR